MSKTMLVAQREFLENMRTKAFWLGILSFPILIALFIVGGRLLAKTKDVRTFTVVDRSDGQWLSQAIDERAVGSDLGRSAQELERRLQEAAKDARAEGGDPEALATALSTLPRELAKNEVQEQLFEKLVAAIGPELTAGSNGEVDVAARVRRVQASLIPWFSSLTPKQLALLHSNLDSSKYRQVRVEAGDGDPLPELNRRINSGELFAYFIIGADPLTGDEGSTYVSNNLTDDDLRNWFEAHATEVVRERRIARLELSDADARSLRDEFDFHEQRVTATGTTEIVKQEEKIGDFAPVAFVYLLWIAVFTAAQMLLTNTVEEKSNRLIEVLLSSVTPLQLMAGKVLGIAATGLTVVASWVISALIGVQFVPETSAIGGAELAAIIGDPLYLTSFIVYFIAGYLLYAAFLVAIGSVCDSLKEAQNLMQPVFIVLIVPLIAMMFVVKDPNGTVARVLTYIPLFTPFLMMNRAGGPPPAWEYVATTVLIVLSLIVAFWGAAKIFRVGILMTGKPPKLREILRWLRPPRATSG